jgi:hypothetical protein
MLEFSQAMRKPYTLLNRAAAVSMGLASRFQHDMFRKKE